MEVLRVKPIINGYRYIVRLVNDEIVSFFSNSTLTNAAMESMEAEYIEDHKYDNEDQAQINVLENEILLRRFVKQIKDNPSVTFTQYSNWINNQQWYEKIIIQYFVYSLAVKIAERKGVDVSAHTESQVFVYIRDWLVNNEPGKIEKVIFNA